jgi:hypothetical protein
MPIMPRLSGCDAGDAADAEQRHGNRNLRALGERDDLALRARQHDAVPARDQRPLGGVDQLERVATSPSPGSASSYASASAARRRPSPRRSCLLRVLGDVDQDRAGPSGLRDRERLAHRRRDVGALVTR